MNLVPARMLSLPDGPDKHSFLSVQIFERNVNMLRSYDKRVFGLVGLLAILSAMPGKVYAAGTASGAKERQWDTPVRANVDQVKVHAASDGKRIFVSEQFSEAQGDEGRRKYYTRLHMLETASGKWVNLVESLAKVVKATDPLYPVQIPSADGKYVLFIGSGGEQSPLSPAWLFDIDSGKARKVAEGMQILAVWGGTKLYITCMSAKGEIGPIRVFDTTSGKTQSMKVCGLVAGADAKGKLLACAYNPTKPDQPLGMRDARSAELGLLTSDGKQHADIGPLGKKYTLPVLISPGSKHIAAWRPDMSAMFSRPGAKEGKQESKSHVLVMKIGGKQVRKVKGADAPLFLSDTGDIIAKGAGSKTVKIWDKKGNARTLAQNVRCACVSGGTLYYVTEQERPKLHAVPIKTDK